MSARTHSLRVLCPVHPTNGLTMARVDLLGQGRLSPGVILFLVGYPYPVRTGYSVPGTFANRFQLQIPPNGTGYPVPGYPGYQVPGIFSLGLGGSPVLQHTSCTGDINYTAGSLDTWRAEKEGYGTYLCQPVPASNTAKRYPVPGTGYQVSQVWVLGISRTPASELYGRC